MCGENTHLLIEEVDERKNEICPYGNTNGCVYDRTQNSFTSQAWSSGDYSIIYNTNVSASKDSIVDGAKQGKITSVLIESYKFDDGLMDTTLFEQADCTGRSWGLTYNTT